MKRDFWKRYGLVLGLSFLVVIMIGIKIAYLGVDWEEESGAKTEEVSPTPQVEEEKLSVEEKYPLWEKLPYEGEGFTIEKYQDELTLLVKNENKEVKETIEMINSWFEENGIASNSHKLIIENQE